MEEESKPRMSIPAGRNYSALEKMQALKCVLEVNYDYIEAERRTNVPRTLLKKWNKTISTRALKRPERIPRITKDEQFFNMAADAKLTLIQRIDELAERATIDDLKYLTEALKVVYAITDSEPSESRDGKFRDKNKQQLFQFNFLNQALEKNGDSKPNTEGDTA
jgi:transposase-like protein